VCEQWGIYGEEDYTTPAVPFDQTVVWDEGETRANVLCRKRTQKKQRVEVCVASREEQIDGSLINREGSQTRTDARIDGKHPESESRGITSSKTMKISMKEASPARIIEHVC